CLQGTRSSLLSRIRDWALHHTSERTLLLHGAAGSGKSAIANTIARQLHSDDLAVVPFFAFNRSVPDRSSSQLIPTWAKHLAELNSEYLDYLKTLPSRQLESSDIQDQHDNLLVGGLASLNGIGHEKPLIFTIDALDECPKGEATRLFRVLRKLLSGPNLPPMIRFLFTYRSDMEILRTFEGLSTLKIPIDNEEGTAEDIRKFVHVQLDDNPDVANMVDDVARAAQTLFECAAALCRELTTTRRPTSTSKRKVFIRRLREGPVMSLYGSYRAILEMYFDEEEDPQLVTLWRRVMGWIFLVRTPQSRRVFRAFAVALLPEDERSDVDQILDWLGSLLSGTTSQDDPISPLHTSLRDFLLDTAKSGSFSVDLGSASQEELSLACLKIMNHDLCFNICGLSTSFALNSDIEDLPKKVEESISPGLRYACLATTHHLRSTLPLPPDVVVNEVWFFLQYQFLFWLEAHSCMQTLQDGPGTMLLMFLEWTKGLDDKGLQETVLDYIKFEKRFREGYMVSAPQVYISGLTFAPRESILSFCYRSRFRNLIMSSGALDMIWPPSEALVIQCHTDVLSVAFSPDGTHIASGSGDGTIRVWDAATGQQVGAPLTGNTYGVQSVAFSPDGTRIASRSADGTIWVWDLAMGQQVSVPLTGHTDGVSSVVFSPNGTYIASGSANQTIRVWDVVTGQQVGVPLTGHTDEVLSVAFSPDSMHIASGSGDETIRLWDAATGWQVGEPLAGHTDGVSSVAFSPDGMHIASGSEDETIRVWDMATRQQVGKPLAGHTGMVSSVTFSPDGTHIASGSGDRTIRVWGVATGQQVGDPLAGHTDRVLSVAFSPDGMHIASGSADKTIRVWDAAMGQQGGSPLAHHKGLLPCHTDWVRSVAFSPDGMRITSGSSDKIIRVWDAVTGQQGGKSLAGHTSWVLSVAFSPDGTHIASGCTDKTIRVWDTVTGQQDGESLAGHTNWVWSVAFSPDGTRIASGSSDGTIRLWDTATGQQVGEPLVSHTLNGVRSVAFSPDSTRIASGCTDKTIRVWNVATGQQVGAPLTGHTYAVLSVAFSPDGTRITSGSDDRTVRVWDAATGQQVGVPLTSQTAPVRSVAFSPDGTRIASGSEDQTIWMWDAATGQQVGEPLAGHTGLVSSVAFSPDGTRIASGSSDGTIRVWD
ncbi:WD40-repeat-containing domain protein, partial [Mycena capillaripes]